MVLILYLLVEVVLITVLCSSGGCSINRSRSVVNYLLLLLLLVVIVVVVVVVEVSIEL